MQRFSVSCSFERYWLLASSCPSVCLSVTLCIVALSGLMYRSKSCTSCSEQTSSCSQARQSWHISWWNKTVLGSVSLSNRPTMHISRRAGGRAWRPCSSACVRQVSYATRPEWIKLTGGPESDTHFGRRSTEAEQCALLLTSWPRHQRRWWPHGRCSDTVMVIRSQPVNAPCTLLDGVNNDYVLYP